MGDFSVSVDELRHTASKMDAVVPSDSELSPISIEDQPDLTLAIAEFVGCLNDCIDERERGIEALAAGLREVADMFADTEADAQADVRALGSVEGWDVP